MHRLRLSFHGHPDAPSHHLSVDGMTPAGPNLSHWPGNRTPARWKADLSTGIALQFARAEPAAQAAFLDGAEAVLNDHYDTDGFGALLAVLRPHVAFAHEEVLLLAAATGDFGTFHTWRAFAIDRIVANLAKPHSPLAAELHRGSDAARSLARYQWLLAHAEQVLAQPESLAVLYRDELERVQAGLQAGRDGSLRCRRHDELGLAVVESQGPVHRMVLNTLAGAFRVLHVEHTRDGPLYRYHDRTESWFELVTFHAPPRRDLRPLAAALGRQEDARDGACWFADAPGEPIPELCFCEPAAQGYGEVTRQRRPSRLPVAAVEAALVAFFAAPPASTASPEPPR